MGGKSMEVLDEMDYLRTREQQRMVAYMDEEGRENADLCGWRDGCIEWVGEWQFVYLRPLDECFFRKP